MFSGYKNMMLNLIWEKYIIVLLMYHQKVLLRLIKFCRLYTFLVKFLRILEYLMYINNKNKLLKYSRVFVFLSFCVCDV